MDIFMAVGPGERVSERMKGASPKRTGRRVAAGLLLAFRTASLRRIFRMHIVSGGHLHHRQGHFAGPGPMLELNAIGIGAHRGQKMHLRRERDRLA